MRLLVYGSKDFARVLRELVRHCGHEFSGFVDDFDPRGPDVVGTYTDALKSHPPTPESGMVVGIGYNHLEARLAVFSRIVRDGYETPTIAHSTAVVAPGAKVGPGSILMAGAIVDVFSELGELSVLWPGAIVNHDCRIGANCFVSPGAVICGFVSTGKSCFFGAGSAIVDHRNVPDGAFVKAGAVYK